MIALVAQVDTIKKTTSLLISEQKTPMKTKLFTIEEANKLLPEVKALLDQLHEIKLVINKHQAEIDVLELLQDADGKRNMGAPSTQYFEKKLEEMQQLFDEFKKLVSRFTELGCELKNLDYGLVDFYSLRDDQIIYLCWKKGEEAIEHWHELDNGFTGRKPL